MSNKSYQQNKRRLASLAKKRVKRTSLQKHARYLTYLNKKFPRCEICGHRNRYDVKCINPHQVKEVKEGTEDALRI